MRVPRSQRGGEVCKVLDMGLLEDAPFYLLSSYSKLLLSDNRASGKQAVVCDNGVLGREGSPSS